MFVVRVNIENVSPYYKRINMSSILSVLQADPIVSGESCTEEHISPPQDRHMFQHIDDALMVGSIHNLPGGSWTPQIALQRLVVVSALPAYFESFGWGSRTVSNYYRCIRYEAHNNVCNVHYGTNGYHALYLLCHNMSHPSYLIGLTSIRSILCAIYLSMFSKVKDAVSSPSHIDAEVDRSITDSLSDTLYSMYDEILKTTLLHTWYTPRRMYDVEKAMMLETTAMHKVNKYSGWYNSAIILDRHAELPRVGEMEKRDVITGRVRCILRNGPSYWDRVKEWYKIQLSAIGLTYEQTVEFSTTCPEIVTLPEGLQTADLAGLNELTWRLLCLPAPLRAYTLGFPIHIRMPRFQEVKDALFAIARDGVWAYESSMSVAGNDFVYADPSFLTSEDPVIPHSYHRGPFDRFVFQFEGITYQTFRNENIEFIAKGERTFNPLLTRDGRLVAVPPETITHMLSRSRMAKAYGLPCCSRIGSQIEKVGAKFLIQDEAPVNVGWRASLRDSRTQMYDHLNDLMQRIDDADECIITSSGKRFTGGDKFYASTNSNRPPCYDLPELVGPPYESPASTEDYLD